MNRSTYNLDRQFVQTTKLKEADTGRIRGELALEVAFKGNWHLKKGKHVDATWMYKRCHAKELSQLRDGRAGNSMLTTATPGLGHAAPAA